jgi:hypothetical protein
LGGAINLSGSQTIIQGLTYPGTDGTNGQVITTNGSGVLTFTTITGSGGGSTDTGSLMRTGSVSGNVLTFTKGDATTFSLTVATGSGGGGSTDTGSLLVTASFNTSTRDITFTKGDASTFKLGAFAITGSNTFVGSQTINSNNGLTISSSAGFGYGLTLQGQQGIKLEGTGGPRIQFPNNTWLNGNQNDDFQFTGDTNDPLTRGMSFFLYGTGSRNMSFRNDSGPSALINFQTTGSGSPFTNLSLTQNQSTFGRVLRLADWNGNSNISMVNVSGSLSLTPSSFNATTASLLHLSASNNNQLIKYEL